jgi:hypothetical protein
MGCIAGAVPPLALVLLALMGIAIAVLSLTSEDETCFAGIGLIWNFVDVWVFAAGFGLLILLLCVLTGVVLDLWPRTTLPTEIRRAGQIAGLACGAVLGLFETARPGDPRPRQAIAQARAWVRGEIRITQARTAAGHANAAARGLRGAARHAAFAAAQAAAVAHVAAHELGAAAYTIKAARATAPEGKAERAGRRECQWQRDQLPHTVRQLVLDDQRLRTVICWSVFAS